MVYGETGGQVHLSLPQPDVRSLASSVNEPPSREICEAISATAETIARESENGQVDAYRLHAEVQLTHPSVSIGQVVWALQAEREVPQ